MPVVDITGSRDWDISPFKNIVFLPLQAFGLIRKTPVANSKTIKKYVFGLGLFVVLALNFSPVFSQDILYQINIDPSNARTALSKLAQQTSTPLLYLDEELGERILNGVRGVYSINEALQTMLENTGINAFLNENGVIVVSVEGRAEDAAGSITSDTDELREQERVGIPDLNISLADEGQEGRREGRREPILEEVVVTGSRIRQASGMTTPTPVTVVDMEVLRQMDPGNMIESLTQLPQFFNNETPVTAGSTVSSPVGASSVNLRGLGVNRTLTLLNGRRVTPYNLFGTVDINTLPEVLVKRVEIVTGGASASYGSDAVAGVINFILDKEFTGFKTDLQRGISARQDGENVKGSLTFGTPVGLRSQLLLSGDFYKFDEIKSYRGRDWYQGWGVVTNTGEVGPAEIIAPHVVSSEVTCGGMIRAPGSSLDRLQFLSDGSVIPFKTSDLTAVNEGTRSQSLASEYGGGSGCDPATATTDATTLTPDIDRESAFAYLDYDVSESTTAYAQATFATSKTALNGDNGILRGPWELTIFRENAFLPESIRTTMEEEGLDLFYLHRVSTSADIDRGRSEQANDFKSFTLGFDTELSGSGFEGWNISGFAQYGESKNRIGHIDFSRTDRIPQALDAVLNPQTGAIECYASRYYAERYGDCIPLNLFGAGVASKAAIDYVLGPTRTTVSDAEQSFYEFSANGKLAEGWGAGSVSMALGVTYRDEALEQKIAFLDEPDPYALVALSTPENDPDLGLRGIPPGFAGDPEILKFASIAPLVKGDLQVKEIFSEIIVPLVSGRLLAQQLVFNGAYRFADYSGSGGVDSWKAGLDWQVTNNLRFRGTLSRDVRAATMSERFNTRGANCGSIRDPQLDGQIIDCSTTTGGNASVDPEEADTLTAGFVYQPSWVEGLSIALDGYDVQLQGSIGQLGPQRIVDDCFAGAEQLCALVIRNAEGLITRIYDVFVNINEERVKGADLEVSYNRDVDLFAIGKESIELRLFTAWLAERSITNLGAPKQELTGEIGGDAYPEWKGTVQLGYSSGGFSVFLQGRYIDSGLRNNQAVEGRDISDNSISSVFYTDLSARYSMESNDNWEFFASINNLTDEAPPVAATFSTVTGGPGQVPGSSMYDRIGRRLTIGMRVQF